MAEPPASQQESSFKLPEVLTRKPRGYIALAGLDARNNAVHRAVWDEFTRGGRRAGRKPVFYRDLPADYPYPKCSENSTNYEEHVPLGILKSGWLRKHSEELPSLVVFFFDLDWSEPLWEERQTECASKVQVIRSALQGRATDIVMVLLQSTPPMPVGAGDTLTSERASLLCAACNLPRLNLFVLPFTDRPQGFITKLEDAFLERSVQYYSSLIRKIRGHKEQLTRQTQHLLHLRLMFKIAFFSEMKQESSVALKLYRAAYNYLLEVMNVYSSEDRALEFKVVAGFLNYKVTRLCFEGNEPLAAINQLKKHIDTFSPRTGPRQLTFQHAEWMARQFSSFGGLFGEASSRGLKAIQTQNPGLYYFQAAMFALERKKLCNKTRLEAGRSPASHTFSLPDVTYVGQRPWRIGLRDDQSTSRDNRQACMAAIQAKEYAVEHSWQIIPLLSKAVSHFKNFRSERMIAYLKMLMGDEYYQIRDYEKSLVILRGITGSYRYENWWRVLTSILQTLLRCSYLLCNVQDYFTAALELVSRYSTLAVEEKVRIQKNITKIFESGLPPDAEPGVERDGLDAAQVLWAELNRTDQPVEFAVQASSHASFVECKTAFSQPSFRVDEAVELQVHLRSSAPLPLSLSKLMVLFYQEEYNSRCVEEGSICLEPNTTQTFTFHFPASESAVGDSLEVHAVEALFGMEGGCAATLVWSNGASEHFSSVPGNLAWEGLEVCTAVLILPRPANVGISLHHNSPALVSEFYSICIAVENREEAAISELCMTLALAGGGEGEAQPSAELYEGVPTTPTSQHQRKSLELKGGRLEKGEKFESVVYLCSHSVGIRKLSLGVTYLVACSIRQDWDPVLCGCQEEEVFPVQTVKPFDVTYKLLSTKLHVTDSVFSDEPFVLMTEIHSTSPWQLYIVNSFFNQPKDIKNVGPTHSQIEGLELGNQDRASECQCLVAGGQHPSAPLGTYTVLWRRAVDSSSSILTSTVTLPPVPCRQLPFAVSSDIPACGVLREVLTIRYTVHNKTVIIQEFESHMGTSEAFMYSGKRQSRFRVLSSASSTLTFNLLPVATGLVPLPTFELVFPRDPKVAATALHNSLPTSIFIKPSAVYRNALP